MIRLAALLASAAFAAPSGGPIYSVAYSPDGAMVATGGADHMLRLSNPGSGTPRQSFAGRAVPAQAVAISPDSKFVASASVDGTVLVVNLSGELHHLDAPQTRGLAFQPGAEPILAV